MRNGFCFLADRLPDSIKGVSMDTRACTAIAIILKMESECSVQEKALYITGKLFCRDYETVLAMARCTSEELDAAIVEYLCGAPQAKTWRELHEGASPAKESVPQQKDFDFIQDSAAIVAAFRQVYGLSLEETCELHWWEFLALFDSLPLEGNSFMGIRRLRTMQSKRTDSPEARAELAKAKRKVALKDTRSPERKQADSKAVFDALEL